MNIVLYALFGLIAVLAILDKAAKLK